MPLWNPTDNRLEGHWNIDREQWPDLARPTRRGCDALRVLTRRGQLGGRCEAVRGDVGDRSDGDHALGLEVRHTQPCARVAAQREPRSVSTAGWPPHAPSSEAAPPVYADDRRRRRPTEHHAKGVPPAIEDLDLEGPVRRSPELCSPDAVPESKRLLRIPENERARSRLSRTSRARAVPATVIESDVTSLGRPNRLAQMVPDRSVLVHPRVDSAGQRGPAPGATASTPATRRFQYA